MNFLTNKKYMPILGAILFGILIGLLVSTLIFKNNKNLEEINPTEKKILEKMETVRNHGKVSNVLPISVNVFHKLKGPEPGKWKDKYQRLKKLR